MINLNIYLLISYSIFPVKLNIVSLGKKKKQKIGGYTDYWGHERTMGGSPGVLSAQLILQPFLHFTYITAHSSTLPSLYLRHNSFSNPSVVLPTSQIIPQPLFRFSYVTRLFTYVTWPMPTTPLRRTENYNQNLLNFQNC